MLHDSFTRRVQSFRIAVTLGGRQIADDVDEDLVRSLEAEWRRVADVQFQNLIAFFFKTFGFSEPGRGCHNRRSLTCWIFRWGHES